MSKPTVIEHRIQRYIIDTLTHQEFARFRDLRPPSADTNLFSYHLTSLLKSGHVQKMADGYTLGQSGLAYVDLSSGEGDAQHTQVKIISMLVVQNGNGDILLQKRTKQPYINTWTLPYARTSTKDVSIEAAAVRQTKEKLNLTDQSVVHAGDAYIRVYGGDSLLSSTLAHVSRFENDDIEVSDTLMWARPHKLTNYRLAPAVQEIVARSFFGDDHFFAEFSEDWPS